MLQGIFVRVLEVQRDTAPGSEERCHRVMTRIVPALAATRLQAEDLRPVTAPVLTIHGRRDRSAPYEGARDWVRLLPNARLVSVENAGHMPWIEKPAEVRSAIGTFLAGDWPAAAERVD